MADTENKKRAIRFTDDEWDTLKKIADQEGVSLQALIVDRCIDSHTLNDPNKSLSHLVHDVRKIRLALRVLSMIAEDELKENGKPEKFLEIIKKAKITGE